MHLAGLANFAMLIGAGLTTVDAQLLTPSKGKSVNLQPGVPTSRLVLAVTAPPAPGDRVEVRSSSRKIEIAIVTPDGRRIDAKNAKVIGVEWSDEVDLVPLGEDTAHTVRVVFARSDLAGSYVVEFAARDLQRSARADVRFVSRLADYAEQIRSVSGAQIHSAQVRGSANIPIDVQSDYAKEDPASLEIALTSPAEKLTLTLPSGKVVSIGPGDGREYSTFAERYPSRDAGFVLLWAIPMDGIHHQISFPNTAKGRYVVHVESAQPQTLVVAFGPFKEIAQATGKWLRETPELLKPQPGQVNLEVDRLPFDCYEGDRLGVIAKLPANLGSKTPEFTVRVQTQPLLASTDIGMHTAPGSILSAQTVTIQAISAMDGKTIGAATVTLRPPAYPLTVNISPSGGETVTPAAGSSYSVGTTVTINATPSAGYSFAGWSGSPDLAGATANPAAIMMKSGAVVTANFTALPTKLKLSDAGKSGPSNARVWRFKVSNSGPGAANAAQLTRVTLSQSNGAACAPVIHGAFPKLLGNLAPASSVVVAVTADFSSCTQARFTMTAELSANSGVTSLSVSRQNQEP